MNCVGAKCDETKIEGSINKLCAFSCILELEESKRNCDSCEQKVNQMEARNMTFSNGKSSQWYSHCKNERANSKKDEHHTLSHWQGSVSKAKSSIIVHRTLKHFLCAHWLW